ncbi:MAG: hypothetical protein KA297_21645 [Kofleriaceae bacterium]|nr:hypothetical protein [Kofleriaceae bacterium]
MSRSVMVLGGLAAAAVPARADGAYGGYELSGVTWRGDTRAVDGNRSDLGLRLAAGYRAERWTLGASVGGDMFAGLFELAVDARYLVPLSAHWTAYARGRVMSARLDRGGGVGPVGADGPAPTDRYAVATDRVGRGLGGGLGLSVGGDVRALGFLFWPLFFTSVGPTVHASVFVERSTDLYRLHGRWDSADVIAERWTLGLGIGKDF